MKYKLFIIAHILLIYVAHVYAQNAEKPVKHQPGGEWPAYGNDAGGTRYSPLQQVNDHNVSSLKVAWIYQTGELKTYEGTNAIKKAAFEATPVMVGHTLY